MRHPANFIAADLGASSGRLVVGQWDGRTFALDELHRFPNGGVHVAGSLHWDVLRIWAEIQDGLTKYRTRFENGPAAIGVDAWGVDFALLDKHGRLLGNPYHYRDSRTDGIPGFVFKHMDERELFSRTGVQTMQINTLFQLYSMARSADPQLEIANMLLMIPDLFHYFLSGAQAVEYSAAATTQMYASPNGWALDVLENLKIPARILPNVVFPGTLLDVVSLDVLRNIGLQKSFPVVATASHDTASAVAAIPNMDANSTFISSGTWSLMGVELRQPVTSDAAFALNFTNEGGADDSVLLLKNITGLWILQECLRQWMSEGHRYNWTEIMTIASSADAFQCVLDVDADDFRMPGNMPRAIAAYCGRTAQSVPQTIATFARCCFESLSLKYRSVLESLEVLTGRRLETIRIVGGGCLNALLCQMTADACNRVVVSGPAEASAFGNVMLQAVATGHLPNVRAGRAAIADSIQCTTYYPHRNDAWDEASMRLGQMQFIA
ncbi:MAG: rhamnulokinase family protein [Acidobacteriaceae bacterium]